MCTVAVFIVANRRESRCHQQRWVQMSMAQPYSDSLWAPVR